MKKNKALAFISLVLLGLWACDEKDTAKDKYDKRLLGRWKITEYYLDEQAAYDTIAKYLEGYEYEFGTASTPQYPDVNGYTKIYFQGQVSYFEFESFSNYAVSLHFQSLTTPPPCLPLQVISGDTITGCFECTSGWDFSFKNDHHMEWNAKNTPNSPIQHSHRLVLAKVE